MLPYLPRFRGLGQGLVEPAFASFPAMILGSMVSVLFGRVLSYIIVGWSRLWWQRISVVLLDQERTLVSFFIFTGQPLGFLSSWPPLAHNFCYGFAPSEPGRRFTDYALLGDDIVIGDRLVSSEYRRLMDQLHVQIYLEKDWVSKTGALEFAKPFFVSGVRVDCVIQSQFGCEDH